MSTFSRIYGWVPPRDEEYLEVPCSEQQQSVFHISQSTICSDSSHSSSHRQPSASNSSSSTLCDKYSEKKSENGRRGDPSWVARPRNPFIIFRCQYAKENCRQGRRIRRPPGTQMTDKTLSKKAGEAWRALPMKKKEQFIAMALQERKQHAQMYPDYRFRPAKRTTGRKRNSCLPSPPSNGQSNTPLHRQSEPSRQLPQLKLDVTFDNAAEPHGSLLAKNCMDSKNLTQDHLNSEMLMPMSSVQGSKGRVYPYTPDSTDSPGYASCDSTLPSISLDFQAPVPELFSNLYSPTPISNSSSSLLNWNGEYLTESMSPLSSTSFTSESLPTPISPLSGSFHDLLTQHPEYASNPTIEQHYQLNESVWIPQNSYAPASSKNVMENYDGISNIYNDSDVDTFSADVFSAACMAQGFGGMSYDGLSTDIEPGMASLHASEYFYGH